MRKYTIQLLTAVLLLSLNFQFTGCAIFLLGAGAAGGYSISKDEIEGFTDGSRQKTWNAVREVIREEGAITLEDAERGHMEALVDKSTVEINMEQATAKTVRLRVKARKTKGLFPDIKTAQRLYGRIMKKAG